MNQRQKLRKKGSAKIVPFLTPSSIMRLAMGACPWPRERAWKCSLMPEASASCSRAPVGSTPGDRTKIRGVLQVDSSTTWAEGTFKASELTLKTEEATGIKKIPADTHSLHVENRRLHKARAEVVNNEGGGAKGDTVLTQGAYYQHPLELIAVTVPITYK